ncbi:MAG: hypothetical protein HRT68_04075 [Flavobacteriaceae bacterium]|nr:hypothetical protein [Flavobacteriaceae bacterium]
MKKLILLLVVIPFLSFQSQTKSVDIIGKWKGVDESKNLGYIIFEEGGYASLIIDGEVMGGKEFEKDGNKGSMTYEANFDTSPVHIDLIITVVNTKVAKKALGIAMFEDQNHMRFAIGFDGKRPTEFTDKNSVHLVRVKE